MSLSSGIQDLIYDIDAMIDASSGDVSMLEDKSRMLNAALLRQAAIEIKSATEEYLDALQCLNDAKACFASATKGLHKSHDLVEKITRVVEAVERILS